MRKAYPDMQVKLLKHLAHENVIGLFDIMRPAESDIATFAVIIPYTALSKM
jgi:hypothetical protein